VRPDELREERLTDEDLTNAVKYGNEGDSGGYPPPRARGWIYALVDECRTRGRERDSYRDDMRNRAENDVKAERESRPPLPTLDEFIGQLDTAAKTPNQAFKLWAGQPQHAPYEGLTAPQSPSQAFMKAGAVPGPGTTDSGYCDEADPPPADLTAIAGLTPSAPAVHWDTWNARLRAVEERLGRLGSIDIPLDPASNDRVDLLMAKVDVLTARVGELSRLHEDLGGRVEKLEHIQRAVEADAKADEERYARDQGSILDAEIKVQRALDEDAKECPGGC
jgi:hypothetical protein